MKRVCRMRRFARSADERGFVTIWILGLCFVILAVGGIAVDLWRGFADRRELASITDAAAIAAASQIDLDVFRANPESFADGTNKDPVPLDEAQARATALAYLNEQAAISGFQYLTPPDIQIEGNQIRIEATRELDLTLLQLLRPGEKLQATTSSVATPEVGV
jgi:uncharacterized membrane protein